MIREQRRYLIEENVDGLDETNRRLDSLIASSELLRGRLGDDCELPDPQMIAELRELAVELQRESRANRLLARRGGEFVGGVLALADGGRRDDWQGTPTRG